MTKRKIIHIQATCYQHAQRTDEAVYPCPIRLHVPPHDRTTDLPILDHGNPTLHARCALGCKARPGSLWICATFETPQGRARGINAALRTTVSQASDPLWEVHGMHRAVGVSRRLRGLTLMCSRQGRQ